MPTMIAALRVKVSRSDSGMLSQLADHLGGKRQRQRLDQVDGAALGLHPVQVFVDQLLHPGPQLLHGLDGEVRQCHLADAGVARRVHGHQEVLGVPGDHVEQFLRRGEPDGERGVRLHAEPVVGQQSLDVIVLRDQPRLAARRHRDLRQRTAFRQLVVLGQQRIGPAARGDGAGRPPLHGVGHGVTPCLSVVSDPAGADAMDRLSFTGATCHLLQSGRFKEFEFL
ncbi:hypothetical protein LUW77_00920 [Streptomyces radiopugnans]|nr:hypothetical protein LUW77_00920 [Streptomyces radiopugnans]